MELHPRVICGEPGAENFDAVVSRQDQLQPTNTYMTACKSLWPRRDREARSEVLE